MLNDFALNGDLFARYWEVRCFNLPSIKHVTQVDIEEFLLQDFAEGFTTIPMPHAEIISLEGNSHLITVIGDTAAIEYEVEIEFKNTDLAAELINKEIDKDNQSPIYESISPGNPFNDEETDEVRSYAVLKRNIWAVISPKVSNQGFGLRYNYKLGSIISNDTVSSLIDVQAVNETLMNHTSEEVSLKTGIPVRTIMKYKANPESTDHRQWISDNALKLGAWANKIKYEGQFDNHTM